MKSIIKVIAYYIGSFISPIHRLLYFHYSRRINTLLGGGGTQDRLSLRNSRCKEYPHGE